MYSNKVNKEVLQVGHEYPHPGEEQTALYIVQLLQDQMTRFYEKGKNRQLRQIHPKMNGCVKAQFIIEPNLPEAYRVGLFKESKTYPAWIRFSNGETKPVPDYKKDIRGVGIKLMNVPGIKLSDVESGTGNVDFILMNTKSFVSSDVKAFGKILNVVTTPKKLKTFIPKLFTVFSNIPLLIEAAKAKIKMLNPAEIPYYSTVPFRFGDENRAVKYGIFPVNTESLDKTDTKSENLIKNNLTATLRKNEILFDFKVQFQTDAIAMPIEDPTVEWTSEFIKLATIRIPVQEFDTPHQNEFGDNLAFNSWRTIAEHQPLGNFNRARKIIYKKMYDFRFKFNDVAHHEPTADENFFNTKL